MYGWTICSPGRELDLHYVAPHPHLPNLRLQNGSAVEVEAGKELADPCNRSLYIRPSVHLSQRKPSFIRSKVYLNLHLEPLHVFLLPHINTQRSDKTPRN